MQKEEQALLAAFGEPADSECLWLLCKGGKVLFPRGAAPEGLRHLAATTLSIDAQLLRDYRDSLLADAPPPPAVVEWARTTWPKERAALKEARHARTWQVDDGDALVAAVQQRYKKLKH